jgi:hypothetical protein
MRFAIAVFWVVVLAHAVVGQSDGTPLSVEAPILDRLALA